MHTVCPNCSRQFHLLAAHLSAAGGIVRCGRCGAQFNALGALHDDHHDKITHPSPRTTAARGWTAPGVDLSETGLLVREEETLEIADGSLEEQDLYVKTVLGDELTMERPSSASAAGWTFLGALFGLALAIQIGWHFRNELIDRLPPLLPKVEQLCERVGCWPVSQRRLDAIQVVRRDVRHHPMYEDLLLVNLTLTNVSAASMPYPHLQVNLYDTGGKPVAQREFPPHDYAKPEFVRRGLPAGVPTHFLLELTGPTTGAAGFEFGLHYPRQLPFYLR